MLTAGSMVKGGFYFNCDQWDLVAVGGKEGPLPGAEGERYRRVPAWAALGLAPLLGGLFVVVLPLALLARYAGRRLVRGVRRTERTVDDTQASRSA